MDSKRRSSLRFWMEVNGAIPSFKLNKICSAEGLTFNLCLPLNHFMVLENIEIETSHFRNVYIMESVLEQRFDFCSSLDYASPVYKCPRDPVLSNS